jgi:hypothetical protein
MILPFPSLFSACCLTVWWAENMQSMQTMHSQVHYAPSQQHQLQVPSSVLCRVGCALFPCFSWTHTTTTTTTTKLIEPAQRSVTASAAKSQLQLQQQQQQQIQLQQQQSATSLKATTSRMLDELSRIRKSRQKTEQSLQKMKQDLEEQRMLGERKKQALVELQVGPVVLGCPALPCPTLPLCFISQNGYRVSCHLIGLRVDADAQRGALQPAA